MPEDIAPEDDFQKELLGLFAMEAYEWFGQILTALIRLEEVAEPATATDALDAMVRGLTSLGGSAATVDLPGIQESIFGLLPLVEQLRGGDGAGTGEVLAQLRQSLAQITASVAESTGSPATVSFDAPTTDLRRAKDFLQALQELRGTQRRHNPMYRHLVDTVMKRVQKDLERGLSQVDGQGIRQYFEDVSKADEDFLGRIQVAVPAIASAISALKTTALQPTEASGTQWKSLQDTLDQVGELARQRQAVPIMHFFQGLSTFVRIVTDRRIVITPKRWELVENRIQAVTGMAQAWEEAGRAERQAIGGLVHA